MKRRWVILLVVIANALGLWAQERGVSSLHNSVNIAIEDYVINDQYDSARLLLEKLNDPGPYGQLLQRILDEKQASYSDYINFYKSATERVVSHYRGLKDFLAKVAIAPDLEAGLNLDYVWLKWYETENANNGLLDIELGTKINNQLKNYIAQFDDQSEDSQRAHLLANLHQLLVWKIGGNIEEGYEQAIANEKVARTLQDTTLLALSIFHVQNFLYEKRDLRSYIQLGKEVYALDRAQRNRSPYYYINMENLLGAYSFMGGKDDESLLLANELHDHSPTEFQSYFSYLEIVETATKKSGVNEKIFEKFGVSSVTDLVKKLNENAEGKTDNEAGWRLAQRSARLLIREGENEAAIEYIQKTVKTLQETYSKDLSQAIADYETNLISKEKEKEVAIEKEKAKTSIAIAAAVGLLLVLAVIGYSFKNRQNREIKEKSLKIERQRDEISRQNDEKELLLKEIHHRVKNNLQVVSSLLDLQSRDIEDEGTLATFMEGQNRVKAMALIHQKLYQNENLATINFEEYAKLLMAELAAIYKSNGSVESSVRAGSHTEFDIDIAVPLGLILNELISNAYKHAFTDHESGKLSVFLEKVGDGQHQLIVADNGKGLPSDFDVKRAKSLGLRLVRRLARQLYGTVTYSGDRGARFVVIFTDRIERKAV